MADRSDDTDRRPWNNLLRALRRADYELLAPHLTAESRNRGDLLYRPAENVETVYFPLGPCLVSFLVPGIDGDDVEAILVGREGAVGGIVSLGFLPAYCRIQVNHPGSLLKLRASALETAKQSSNALRHLFGRYADCLIAQVFQSTACNATHSIDKRAAKWILAAMERTGDHQVPLTHEELAGMLGVGRSYATRVLQRLRIAGALETRRGILLVRDA